MDLSKADKLVRNARAGGGDQPLGGGLSVRVGGDDTKTMYLRAKVRGSVRRFRLGSYPAITVKQAYEAAIAIRSQIKEGLDPQVEEKRAREGADAPVTVSDAAKRFIDQHVRHNLRPDWAKETERMMNVEVLPKIGSYTFKQLTKADLSNLISKKAEAARKANRKAIAANRLSAVLSRFIRFCADHGWVNEAVGLRLPKPALEQSRERMLNPDEMREAWIAAQCISSGEGASPAIYGQIISLLMLTGWRTSEITRLTVALVDPSQRTISVLLGKTKSSKRTVMLPPSAWSFIQARLNEMTDAKPNSFLFVQPNGGAIKSNEVSRAARLMPKLTTMVAWTPRDLRRTVISVMSEAGVDGDVRRRVTGHVAKDIHGKVYDKSQRLKDGHDALLTVERMLFDANGSVRQASASVVDLATRSQSVA